MCVFKCHRHINPDRMEFPDFTFLNVLGVYSDADWKVLSLGGSAVQKSRKPQGSTQTTFITGVDIWLCATRLQSIDAGENPEVCLVRVRRRSIVESPGEEESKA